MATLNSKDIVPGVRTIFGHLPPDAAEDPTARDRGGAPTAPAPGPEWPTLHPAALTGLAGDFVSLVEPHTEADPAAILTGYLVASGSEVGRGPHYANGGIHHWLNLFAALTGPTSRGRKGTAWNLVRSMFATAAPEWTSACISTGLSTGEGLIHDVRDAVEKQKPVLEKGKLIGYERVITDPGVEDKRILLRESEFARPLRAMKRPNSILSTTLRCAWDGDDLATRTRTNPLRATAPHISMIADITQAELSKEFSTTEVANGLGNRILWVCVRRSKSLALADEIPSTRWNRHAAYLRDALGMAANVNGMAWSQDAKLYWEPLYGKLSQDQPGILGAMIARAEGQVPRLAALYALLGGSRVIRSQHLASALAFWKYCEDSARFLFASRLEVDHERVLTALREVDGGLTRDEIRDLFGRHKRRFELDAIRDALVSQGLITVLRQPTGGRPAEVWEAT